MEQCLDTILESHTGDKAKERDSYLQRWPPHPFFPPSFDLLPTFLKLAPRTSYPTRKSQGWLLGPGAACGQPPSNHSLQRLSCMLPCPGVGIPCIEYTWDSRQCHQRSPHWIIHKPLCWVTEDLGKVDFGCIL
jgi:hypothetical protein